MEARNSPRSPLQPGSVLIATLECVPVSVARGFPKLFGTLFFCDGSRGGGGEFRHMAAPLEPCFVGLLRDQHEIDAVAHLFIAGGVWVQAVGLGPGGVGRLQFGGASAVGQGRFEVDVAVEYAALDVGVDLFANALTRVA